MNFITGPNGSPILTGPIGAGAFQARFRLPGYVLALLTGATLLAGQSALKANTADNVNNGSTDLTLPGSYAGGTPTTTSDVTFTNVAYNPAAFTLNTSLSIGTLDDLDTTQTLTIQNSAAGTTSVLTLNGGTNSVSGTAADLLFVAGGGTLSLGGGTGTGTLNLTLATAGNFNIAGTANISSAISATGLGIAKNGAGTLNLLGAGTSTTGRLTQNTGTITFGSTTDAPTYTVAEGTIGVYVIGGNFNMANGSLTSTSGQGLVLNGNNTYAQTGGTFATNGRIELANGGGTSMVNVSAGTLSTTLGSGIETVRGTSIITLSGTGAITAPLIDLTTTQLSGGAAGSTFNLNGGTLTTGQVIAGNNGTTGSGTVFNFNGGLLTTSASSATFMQGLTSANVLAGGAIINTGTFTDTINQNLLASTTSTGGGLTKNGTGTLILSGTNTYTGANVIVAGALGVTSDSSLGAVPAAAANNIQFTGTTGTLQDTANNVTLSANRNITVANASTVTLDSLANTFTVGGAVSISGAGATATTLALTNSGTGTGTGDLTGTLSDAASTGGLAITKTGTGAWTLGGNGTSTLAKGSITESAGTLNFGSATETPSLTISALATPATANLTVSGGTFNLNAGTLSLTQATTGTVNLTGGSFNVNGGTLTVTTTVGGGVGITSTGDAINISGGTTTVTAGQGLVLSGAATATYTQSGGTFSTNGFIEFANNGGTSTVNISGGSLTTTNTTSANDAFDMAVRGTTTLNLSGTGMVTTPILNLSTSQINSPTGTAASTFNLNGGTLITGRIIPGTNFAGGTGTTFNFNGGILQASASSTTFLQGITAANVRAGGATINTNGFNITVAQPLLTGTASGTPDGGLTKNGAGILTLTAANTYTGPTTLNVGALTLTTSTALSDTALLNIVNGTTFNLNAANGTSEIVGSLVLGGTAIAPNTYTAAQLTGLDNNITFSTSAGETLTVAAAVPEPSTWAAGLTCIGLLGFKLRRRLFARL